MLRYLDASGLVSHILGLATLSFAKQCLGMILHLQGVPWTRQRIQTPGQDRRPAPMFPWERGRILSLRPNTTSKAQGCNNSFSESISSFNHSSACKQTAVISHTDRAQAAARETSEAVQWAHVWGAGPSLRQSLHQSQAIQKVTCYLHEMRDPGCQLLDVLIPMHAQEDVQLQVCPILLT